MLSYEEIAYHEPVTSHEYETISRYVSTVYPPLFPSATSRERPSTSDATSATTDADRPGFALIDCRRASVAWYFARSAVACCDSCGESSPPFLRRSASRPNPLRIAE